jgi:hypothetical protein
VEPHQVWKGIFHEKMMRELNFLSMHEAVFGDPLKNNVHGLDFSTSMGYPWTSRGYKCEHIFKRGVPGNVKCNEPAWYKKLRAYGQHAEVQLPNMRPVEIAEFEKCDPAETEWIHPEFQYVVYERIRLRLMGVTPLVIFQFCLKDEDRDLDRVEKEYTRFFAVGSKDFTVEGRMLMGDWISLFETTLGGDSAVGVNPYSTGWKILLEKLERISKNFVSHDVGGYDLHYQVYYIINEFAKHAKIHHCISDLVVQLWSSYLCSTFCTLVAYKKWLILIIQMPSGCIITCVLNTVLNSVTHRSCWFIISDQPFDKMNAMWGFGDDSNVAVRYLADWDGKEIALLRKMYFDQDCTEQDKTPKLKTHISPSETVFLQRSYVRRDGLVLAPLNKESIISATQWLKKSKVNSPEKQLVINCHWAIRESALHGKEYFQEIKEKLNPFLHRRNPTYKFTDSYETVYAGIIASASEPPMACNYDKNRGFDASLLDD